MKNIIKDIVLSAAQKAFANGLLPANQMPDMEIEAPRHDSQGDLSTNFAMVSATIQKMAPKNIAQALVSHMEPVDFIEKIEVAGPGFINFFLRPSAWHPVVDQVLAADERYGASDFGKNEKVQVEFVSANPTGPLHVGHGRGAAVGDAVGNILAFAGFTVSKEYYINDSGRQIKTLGTSVWFRLLELTGQSIDFPDDCYKGDYIRDLARQILEQEGPDFVDQTAETAIPVCASLETSAGTWKILAWCLTNGSVSRACMIQAGLRKP